VKLSLDTTDRNDLIVRDRTHYMHRRKVLVILGDMCRTGVSTETQLWTLTRHGYSNLTQVVVYLFMSVTSFAQYVLVVPVPHSVVSMVSLTVTLCL
jgi:hypothetical protein